MGRPQAYVCESSGISTLERNGLTRDMFPVGANIRIDGVRSRRDPNFCFFRTVHLADGRTLSTSGNDRDPDADAALPRRNSIAGTWMIIPAGRSSSGPWEMINYLTPEGEAAVAGFDPFLGRSDPALPAPSVFAGSGQRQANRSISAPRMTGSLSTTSGWIRSARSISTRNRPQTLHLRRWDIPSDDSRTASW